LGSGAFLNIKLIFMKEIIFIVLAFFNLSIGFSQVQKEYTNPILAGFYPDPSICKVNGDYYLINSTFAYFPGLPVFHSKDLVNWEQIGFALDRPTQLNLEGAGVSRGLFAPDINYHNGTFYIVCTFIDKMGNFVISAKNPAGPWSNPVAIPEVDGIDPSLFFDEINGNAYLIYNSVAPDNKPLYDGHRTLRMRRFDINNFKVTGEEKILINGGTDISTKPVWIEGPHIFMKNGYYYLIAAEGGTGYNHSEVVFRSKNIEGPYDSYVNNPILTQRQLDRKRPFPITTTGHADFTQSKNGDWYAVFLGCRPYDDNYYNTGRETFMAPITWKDDWPIITQDSETIKYFYPFPQGTENISSQKYSGNFVYKDDFKNKKLNYSWQFLRTPLKKWYSLNQRKGSLAMNLQPITCSDKSNPSFLGWRQAHLKGYASTSLDFDAITQNEKAGMLIFQSENHFYYLCKSVENTIPVVQLYQSDSDEKGDGMKLLASQKLFLKNKKKLQLKIEANNDTYSFYYQTKKTKWNLLKDKVDAKFLSTTVAGGFVGCMYALYATSSGKETKNIAYFNWFETANNDDVYNK
jgi:xylan 1,4-beta-xylosidase